MAYSTKIILPDNLRSESLNSEFIELGKIYVNKKSSQDPNLDLNRNLLKFKFEVRDAETRQTVYTPTRIKNLYISNDPQFDPSATLVISNFPAVPAEYDPELDYTINLNPQYFYDTSLSSISSTSSAAGTGYFLINNWPLSANGGLSTVYFKVVLSIGNDQAEYPNGGGVFDQIYWEGQYPTTPSQVEYSSLKSGWTGAHSLITFKSASDANETNLNGPATYLGSIIEVAKLTGSYNLNSAIGNTNIYLTSLATSAVGPLAALSFSTYGFVRNGTALPNPSTSFTYNSPCAADINTDFRMYSGGVYSKGVSFDGETGLTLDSTNNGVYVQSKYTFDNTSAGNGYTISFFNTIKTQSAFDEDQIVTRVDVSDLSFPEAYMYTVTAPSGESTLYQRTTLPAHIAPKILEGGIFETYLQDTGNNEFIVESYFTENIGSTHVANLDKKSYLLSRSLMPHPSQVTDFYPQFNVFYNGSSAIGVTVRVQEIISASGPSIIAADLGDCKNDDFTGLNFPITSITSNWDVYFDEEMKQTNYYEQSSSTAPTYDTDKITVPKIQDISIDTPYAPSYQEFQFLKPSLSNRASLTLNYQHNCDELYVVFASDFPTDLNYASVLGINCDPEYNLSEDYTNNETLVVRFSAIKNEVNISQRNADKSLSNYVLRSYKPLTGVQNDTYTIEITDFNPEGISGTSQRKSADATWVCLRRGSNIEGYIQLSKKFSPNENGLGYYVGFGFKEDEYGTTSDENFVYEAIFKSLPGIEKDYFNKPESIRSFMLANEGASKAKPYLGQVLMSSNTDFNGFNYVAPPAGNATNLVVSCATAGGNIDDLLLVGSTLFLTTTNEIDGVAISSLNVNDLIIIKDQVDNSYNKIYKKVNNTTFTIYDSYVNNQKITVSSGTVNANTIWFVQRKGAKRYFYNTIWFKDIEISSFSSFISTAMNPLLLEIKSKWTVADTSFPYDEFKIRFYSNDSVNNVPDSPISNWISFDTETITSTISTLKSNNDLVQFVLADNLLSLDAGEKIWLAVNTPMGVDLGTANGIKYDSGNKIESGKYAGWNLASDLWFKLFARYSKRRSNTTHLSIQQARISALSHSGLSSDGSNISLPTSIDIKGPADLTSSLAVRPTLSLHDKVTVRTATFEITASDIDSGILAFRFAKETDYGLIYFEPWQSWDLFTNYQGDNLYTVFFHGSSRYDYAGASNNLFAQQNIGYSGARKVWVQLMDFAGNISESYPYTFVAQAIAAVDTEAPSGAIEFYNLETNKKVLLTNKTNSWLKVNGTDTVSGIKDFKIRRVYNDGPSTWSNWQMYNSYAPVLFTNESDGVKKVEIAFRDYGNNITQPEVKWNKIIKIKK
jgi:hypothetical protein